MTDLVLPVHVAGAIVWIVGTAALGLVGIRRRNSPDPGRLHTYARAVSLVGVRILIPAAAVVLGSGLWLVAGSSEFGFGQPWVLAGFAMLFLAAVSGASFLGRGALQLEQALVDGTPDRAPVERALDRVLTGCGLVLVLLVLAFLDMGLKPGA